MCQKLLTCFKIIAYIIMGLMCLAALAVSVLFYYLMITQNNYGPNKPTSWDAKGCYGDVIHPTCIQEDWFPKLDLSIDIPILTLVARDKQNLKNEHG